MYAAIDLLADKLDAQVRKHKEKITDHHRARRLRSRKRLGSAEPRERGATHVMHLTRPA